MNSIKLLIEDSWTDPSEASNAEMISASMYSTRAINNASHVRKWYWSAPNFIPLARASARMLRLPYPSSAMSSIAERKISVFRSIFMSSMVPRPSGTASPFNGNTHSSEHHSLPALCASIDRFDTHGVSWLSADGTRAMASWLTRCIRLGVHKKA